MMHQVQFEQWVPFPIDKVFLFFANPQNLPRIMPPETATEILALKLKPPPVVAMGRPDNWDSLAGAGSEIVTSFRLLPFLPFRGRWVALITEFEWNRHFADVQQKGPFKSFQHRHQLARTTRDQVSGTIIRDVIDYEVGFGPLGELADKFFIAQQLQRTFAYRQSALVKLLS
ncbi:MAG: SRPBCC family protein [Terriglobales bacterium]